MTLSRRLFLLALCAVGTIPVIGMARHAMPAVQSNDNRKPAGVLRHDTLRINLTLQMATWHPEAADGPGIDVSAFAEDGKAPQIPAPLIRVPVGTVIIAQVRNALTDSTLALYGLRNSGMAATDSVRLRPGESATVQMKATAAGTFLYGAKTGKYGGNGKDERETNGGAFVVDPVGGSPPDRIFVMNIWGHAPDTLTYSNALTINGRSWPYDERIDVTMGDSVHWRVINATGRGHPMHMHGMFFRVDSKGNASQDSVYDADHRRLAVTEVMAAYTTYTTTWTPVREGNWLFHCHIGYHVTRDATLHPPAEGDTAMRMDMDPTKHMAGLVLGMAVHPKPGVVVRERGPAKTLHLFIDEGKRQGMTKPNMGYVLQEGALPPAADSVVLPGTVIMTTQNEPTDVVIRNRLREATAVHWHGLELESYSDGVAGWSGTAKRLAPMIAPGDSFVAHLTLRRPGTFIYHTHMNDLRQMTMGLYGAVIVLPPGKTFDPSTDHVYVIGDDATRDVPVVINGETSGPVLELKAGVPHRMRFVNMAFALGGYFGVYRDSTQVPWRIIAKDGADLPAAQAALRSRTQLIVSGETYDFEWTPAPGEYLLLFGGPDPRDPKQRGYSQRLVVK